jgi:Zn-dependent protease
VQERVSALETKAPIAARKPKLEDDAPGRIVAGVAAVGLALWKLKAFVPMAATMLLSFGAYWTAYGWRFAAGLVMSIWIHEMGHVLELKRLGLRASLPMFIPGVGAVVRLQQRVPDAHTDAKIGLAGPLFGALAALGCLCVRVLGGGELWLGLAQAGALINLFNLTPLWQLDGGRAFNALSPGQRALCTLAIGAALGLSGQMLLALPLIGAVLRLVGSHAPREGDLGACVTFLGLVAGLTAVASLRF